MKRETFKTKAIRTDLVFFVFHTLIRRLSCRLILARCGVQQNSVIKTQLVSVASFHLQIISEIMD